MRLSVLDGVWHSWHLVFSSHRPAHTLLCCGRRKRVVLPAVAGDPAQSFHLTAEQSPEAGGELRAHREGVCVSVCVVATFQSLEYLLCSLQFELQWALDRKRIFFPSPSWWIYLKSYVPNILFYLMDFCVLQTGHRLNSIIDMESVIRPENGKQREISVPLLPLTRR